MAVYFIRALGTDLMKIGSASNVMKRLGALQTGSPHRLWLMHICDGGLKEEGDLHRRFAQFRRNGEWFALSDEHLREEFTLFGNAEYMNEPVPENELMRVIFNLGGRSKVASLFGVTGPAVSNWIARNAFPARLHLRVYRECQARGIPYDPAKVAA